MIEINLLPEELRKRKREIKIEFAKQKLRFLIIAGAIGIFICVVLILTLGVGIRKRQMQAMLAREKAISSARKEAEEINQEVSVLKLKLAVLGQLTERDFLWAKKLNELSDLILPGIWFTHIYTDAAEGRFIIDGSVISKKQEAMATVGKFMKNIREDKSFFKDFTNIKLESVQRKGVAERDIVDFEVVLYFKEHDGS